ncbi:MAG: DUF2878 domain-containing protein [Methylophaga sp.]|nr:DUF2878 domain-containing protein [Methylophaga sp.]
MAKKNIINFILFQISWLVCVLSGAADNNVPAVLITVMFVLVHFRYFAWRYTDFRLIVSGLLVGLLLDSSYSATGLIAYNGQSMPPIAPWWILCLWVNFMLTLNHSLSWLLKRRWLAALLAGVGSPLSYFAGQKLGALSWLHPEMLIMVSALTWAIAVPFLFKLANYWRKQEQAMQHALA